MVELTRVRELLDYDVNAGIFRWRRNMSSRVRAGDIAKQQLKNGYVRIEIDGKRYLAHRLAWFYVNGEWPHLNIDHIDGNRANNSFYNLRLATQSQNKANQGVTIKNRLGIKGVSFRPGLKKPYTSQIAIGGKLKRLGYFSSAEEAHSAYKMAALAHYGEFAHG